VTACDALATHCACSSAWHFCSRSWERSWLIYTTVTEAPAVVAAVLTGILAILGLGVQRYFEQQREDERIRRERMEPIYEQLVRQLHLIAGDSVEQSDVEAFFGELAQSLQLWGAPPVVKAFNT
jgi:hypothetical protein